MNKTTTYSTSASSHGKHIEMRFIPENESLEEIVAITEHNKKLLHDISERSKKLEFILDIIFLLLSMIIFDLSAIINYLNHL